MRRVFFVVRYEALFDHIQVTEEREISVGHRFDSVLCLQHTDLVTVKKYHADIDNTDTGLVFKQGCGSTTINGRESDNTCLEEGDELVIGPYIVTVWYSAAAALIDAMKADEDIRSSRLEEKIGDYMRSRLASLRADQRRVLDLLLQKMNDDEIAARMSIERLEVLRIEDTIVSALSSSQPYEVLKPIGYEYFKLMLLRSRTVIADVDQNDPADTPDWLTNLRTVDLRGSHIIGPAIRYLRTIPHLHTVYLSGEKISDLVLSTFWRSSVQFLFLEESRTTLHGRAYLRELNPTCVVSPDP